MLLSLNAQQVPVAERPDCMARMLVVRALRARNASVAQCPASSGRGETGLHGKEACGPGTPCPECFCRSMPSKFPVAERPDYMARMLVVRALRARNAFVARCPASSRSRSDRTTWTSGGLTDGCGILRYVAGGGGDL